MGNLKDFIGYLDNRISVATAGEKQLCALQEKYETFFGEVTRVREGELAQLTSHILADRGKLPAWVNERLDAARAEVERELDERLAALEQERARRLAEAERLRVESLGSERDARKMNETLDRDEEELKARSAKLLSDIARYNDEIRQLGRGFGFFANLFKMRRLGTERAQLDKEQADIAARIEALRARWAEAEKSEAATERERQIRWIVEETEAAGLQTKIDHVRETREQILCRSAIERVLFQLAPELAAPQASDPPCPRCQTPNPAGNAFCHICAQRLLEDRPDFEGSLREIAELNLHFQRFSEGMKAGQEIIGLVRGLKSGLEAFQKSVRDVKASQDKHKLSTLRLDVPASSVSYGQHLERVRDVVRPELSLHPQVFAQQVTALIGQVFTEAQIKAYFEAMGQELSAQATSQWG